MALTALLTDRFVSFRFHACRYPNSPSDTAHKFDPATHNHVVFVRNNRFFEVQLARADGTELSAADLETYAFWFVRGVGTEDIYAPLVPSPTLFARQIRRKGVPFGALTSENRDNWAHVRGSVIFIVPSDDIERSS
jgi:carnitine O-acetyltransferase